jgi:hypothetical protein
MLMIDPQTGKPVMVDQTDPESFGQQRPPEPPPYFGG